jgi:hypothetical protein
MPHKISQQSFMGLEVKWLFKHPNHGFDSGFEAVRTKVNATPASKIIEHSQIVSIYR